MKMIFVLIALIIINFNCSFLFAQCADAGVCSVGGHSKEEKTESIFVFFASYKFGYSGKDDDVKYHSLQLNGNYNLLSKTSVQFIIPYNIQSGPAGNVNGIGDLILSVNQKLISDKSSLLDASVGVKLATGDDNKDNLPMPYQSGLGSNDLMFLLNYSYYKIGIGVGYQLAGKRNNNLLKLKRGDDLLVRASYNLNFDSFTIIPQLLFIKRLEKSSIVNLLSLAPTESYIEVDESDQTQLNLLTNFQYNLNEDYTLFADFAFPFIERKVNVDGLTRTFSTSIGVRFNFN